MIRNIDSIECLLVALAIDSQVTRLAVEALDEGAAVAIGDWVGGCHELFAHLQPHEQERVRLFSQTTSFTQARRQMLVRPQGFGGSDGFGSKPREQKRAPLSARTVVLTDERLACVEAMRSGMRSVGVVQSHWSAEDVRTVDEVADVVLDELSSIWASDLSTPGAFWLNPPLPRTEDGSSLPDPDEQEQDVDLPESSQHGIAAEGEQVLFVGDVDTLRF